LDLKKFDATVICPSKGPLVDRINGLGIPVKIIPRDPSARYNKNRINKLVFSILVRIKWITRLFNFLLNHDANLIYLNTISNASPLIIAKILHMPILVHMRESKDHLTVLRDISFIRLREGYLTYPYLFMDVIRRKLRIFIILNFPDKFICNSKATKQLLLEKGVSPKKIEVVYNGIDVNNFRPSEILRKNKIRDLELTKKDILVGFIGQLIPRKGIDDFIKAAKIVHKKNDNCKFLIVGGPTDSPFFRKKIFPLYDKEEIRNFLCFTGFKEDIKEYLSAIDIFVNPSKSEPFGRVNIEAMAMEKPVIATNTGGNPEVIVDGETGYLIPEEEPQCLADKILKLMKRPDIREKFGKAGRRRVEKYFSITQYYRSVENVLDR